MPRTKKVAHKQTGRKPKDTTTSYRTFQSDEAKDRYEKFTSDRTFCSEKGFLLQNTPTMRYEDFINSVITKHQWRQFYAHPTVAVVPIVREFYAHFAGDGHCVDITWIVSTQGALTIPRTRLTPQCKVWYHFLTTRLMSSTHVQTMPKDRVLFLDSIISGRPINVGKIFFQELRVCATKKSGSLWFSSLVTSLCVSSGVSIFDNEERLFYEGAITNIAIARLTQTKMAGGPSEPLHSEEDESSQAPQATTSCNAAASSNRDPTHAELTQSLKLLEQRMSLVEKSLQKNCMKPVFPFPKFSDNLLEPVAAEEDTEEVEEDGEED
ncbi:hypothetical protein TIFTF001_036619 [Ficus carica]|uniref:Putative plant transposon protein domain-containing protein n=1 Tax=Ficus carica TaxID=3494 RepID=A0AA88E3R3_FICCA|nr:hypothetical protein TIFTF001_036615 [Ficus carica]GMN67562.1 hypothetical protein TIFTF001_036619 [Ficus carica]